MQGRWGVCSYFHNSPWAIHLVLHGFCHGHAMMPSSIDCCTQQCLMNVCKPKGGVYLLLSCSLPNALLAPVKQHVTK